MILEFLEKIGRKRIIYDRGPSHSEFINAKPWMERYYLLFRKRPKWFPFNIFIHKILDDDHGEGVHNHMCPYITIILKGGYWETTIKGKFWRPQGYIGFRSADHLHRVDLEPNTDTITIFIPGPFGLRQNQRASYNTKLK